MRHYRLLFISACVIVLSPCRITAQDATPVNRQTYVAKTYSVTLDQAARYEKLLADKGKKVKAVNDKVLSVPNRDIALSAVYDDFKKSVNSLFTPSQYQKWIENTQGQEKIRSWKEDYNFSENQITLLLQYKDKLEKAKKEIRAQLIPYAEQEALTTKLKSDYENQVKGLVGQPMGETYLAYRKQDALAVKFVKKYGNISYNTATVIARYEIAYDTESERIKSSEAAKAVKTEQLNLLASRIEKEVKAAIPAEAFAKWKIFDNPSFQRKLMLNYGLNKSQAEQYKVLVNQKAIDVYKAKHSKVSKEEKRLRIQSLESEFAQKVQACFPVESYQKWLVNHTYNVRHRNLN